MSKQNQPDHLYDLVTRIVEEWKNPKADPNLRSELWREYEDLYISSIERDPLAKLPLNPRYDFGIRFDAALTDEEIQRRYKPAEWENRYRDRAIAQSLLHEEGYYEKALEEELSKKKEMQEHFLRENNMPFYESVTKGIALVEEALKAERQKKDQSE